MIRVVFLGPPGAGKGTQAQILVQKYGVRQIATGDILRRHRQQGTPLGKEAQGYMDRGELVPDALIIKMFAEELGETEGFILDGFPRTVPQAQALDELLVRLKRPLTAVLLFETERNQLIARLTGRWTNPRTGRVYHEVYDPPKQPGICDDDGQPLMQRPDDREETVTKRLDVYEQQTAPLIEYYQRTGLLVQIDAMKPVDVVSEDIVAALGLRIAT
jgi:adenylate kinase